MSNKPSENDDLEKEKMGGSYQVSTREDYPLPSNANNFCVESDPDCRYSGPYILFPFTIQQIEYLLSTINEVGAVNHCKWSDKWIGLDMAFTAVQPTASCQKLSATVPSLP